MNPMAQEALASIIRWVLAIGAGFLVKNGIWTAGDATGYVSAAALALVAIGWSLWQKYESRMTLLTALAAPSPMSEASVKARVANGLGVQSVTTAVAVIPKA